MSEVQSCCAELESRELRRFQMICDCIIAPLINERNAAQSDLAALREELVVVTVQRDVWKRITKKMFETKMTAYQRAEAAEQRNANLTEALEDLLKGAGNSPGANKRYAKARAALKPTESGASE